MNYKVTIYVPVYNVSAFIERCAHSLFKQTLSEIEYIFIDDCTPDDSIEKLKNVLKQYPERQYAVKIIRNETNKGLSTSNNIALKLVSAPYFIRIDSDDYIDINMIKTLYNKAVDTNADIVMCNFFEELATGKRILRSSNYASDKEELMKNIIMGKAASLCNKLIAQKLLTENNIKTDFGRLNLSEDLVITMQYAYYAKKIESVDNHYYYYCRNSASITNVYNLKHIQDSIKAISEIEEFFKRNNALSKYNTLIQECKCLRKYRLIRGLNASNETLALFPEINNIVLKLKIPLKQKAILYFGYKCPTIIFRTFIKLLNKLST